MEKQSLEPPRDRVYATEEDEEEMKMEAFFALVRNFKEMRDRRRKELMIGCDGGDETSAAAGRKRKKIMETVRNPSTWIPRFEKEDFDEDFQVRGPPLVLPKPFNIFKEETAVKKKNRTEEDFLDLNLAL